METEYRNVERLDFETPVYALFDIAGRRIRKIVSPRSSFVVVFACWNGDCATPVGEIQPHEFGRLEHSLDEPAVGWLESEVYFETVHESGARACWLRLLMLDAPPTKEKAAR